MKSLFTIVLLTICSINLFASSPVKPDNTYSFDNVFFEDCDNMILYIDFEGIYDHIESVTLYKGKKEVFHDNVDTVPDNAIYELELDNKKKGKYTIELVTDQNIKIRKQIKISSNSIL